MSVKKQIVQYESPDFIDFKSFLKDLNLMTNTKVVFLENFARKYKVKTFMHRSSFIEFISRACHSCYSLRHKSFLYFVLSYIYYRIMTKQSLHYEEIVNDDFKKFLNSQNTQYFDILKTNYDSLKKSFNDFLISSDIPEESLLSDLEYHLTTIKDIIDKIETLYLSK